ncbi:MAG: hypothetical protein ACI8TQ_002045 [Planctomycetota bacterium]|jgi:hypothetical protein
MVQLPEKRRLPITSLMAMAGLLGIAVLAIVISQQWTNEDSKAESKTAVIETAPYAGSIDAEVNQLSTRLSTRVSLDSGNEVSQQAEVQIQPQTSNQIEQKNFGGTIEGRVTSHGEPVRATLFCIGPDGRLSTAKTDANGIYRRADLEPGTWRVLFSLEPTGSFYKRIARLDPRDLKEGSVMQWDFEFYPDGTEVLGGRVVFENGQLAVGAEVLASHYEGPVRKLATTTDDQGKFEFAVPKGQTTAWSVRANYGVSRASLHRLTPPQEALEIRIPTLGKLSVRLIDFHTGESLKPRRLEWREPGSTYWERWSALSRLDALAPTRLELPIGQIELCATAHDSDYLVSEISKVLVQEGLSPSIDLVVKRGIQLSVVFVSEEGKQEFPPGGANGIPDLESQAPFENPDVIWKSPGEVLIRLLRPGTYEWKGDPAFSFDPPSIELGAALNPSVVIEWRVANEAALRAMLSRIEEFERMLKENPGAMPYSE